MSREPRIDAYIAKAAPFAQPILERMFANACTPSFPTPRKRLKWSAPSFVLDGKILLMMAAFKAHAALNFWRGQEIGARFGRRRGNGSVRQAGLDRRPAGGRELDALIREAASLPSPFRPAQDQACTEAAPQLHPEFAEALDEAPKAKAALDGFRRRRSATISNGSPTRSRTPLGRSASPPPSNGSAKASAGTGSIKIAERLTS